MIVGIGTDLVELDRLRRILGQSSGMRFIERVLTPQERSELDRRLPGALNRLRESAEAASPHPRLVEYVAGRFAAKEAVVKALGCGIGREAGFQDVAVLPGAAGRPECTLSEGARERLHLAAKNVRVHLSITHTASLAAAYAVVEELDARA